MPEIRGGSALIARWIHSAGTLTMNTQYRTLETNEETDMLETSAGSINWREYIQGLSNGAISSSFLYNGTASPIGTADMASILTARSSGTIEVFPLGTATGNPRVYGAAFIMSRQISYPYDDVVEVNLEFQINGELFTVAA